MPNPSKLAEATTSKHDGFKPETELDGPLTPGDVGLMTAAALKGIDLAYVFGDMILDYPMLAGPAPSTLTTGLQRGRVA